MACTNCNNGDLVGDCPCRFEVPCSWCGHDDDVRTMQAIGRRWMCERCRDYFGADQVATLVGQQRPIVH